MSFVKWPRDCMRYYWHFAPIYDKLELELCSNQPSMWAYQQSMAQPVVWSQVRVVIENGRMKLYTNVPRLCGCGDRC